MILTSKKIEREREDHCIKQSKFTYSIVSMDHVPIVAVRRSF